MFRMLELVDGTVRQSRMPRQGAAMKTGYKLHNSDLYVGSGKSVSLHRT